MSRFAYSTPIYLTKTSPTDLIARMIPFHAAPMSGHSFPLRRENEQAARKGRPLQTALISSYRTAVPRRLCDASTRVAPVRDIESNQGSHWRASVGAPAFPSSYPHSAGDGCADKTSRLSFRSTGRAAQSKILTVESQRFPCITSWQGRCRCSSRMFAPARKLRGTLENSLARLM